MAPEPCRRSTGSGGHGHRAEEVGLEQRAQLGVGSLLERTDDTVPGIVDEHVDAAEPLHRSVDGSSHCIGHVDVERDGQHAIRCERHEIGDAVDAARGRDHVVPLRERVLGERASEAGRGACDEPGLGRGVQGGSHGSSLHAW
jgi:hypothetical protein